MKKYKIIYYVGDSIGTETIVKKGELIEENRCLFVVSDNERIALDKLYCVELIKINGLGRIIKIFNDKIIIFLAVYRLFINIGTGFVITNHLGTVNIKENLDVIIRNQAKDQTKMHYLHNSIKRNTKD